MARNYIMSGDVLDYTNTTGSALASGAMVLIGVRVGVVLSDIANGATGSARVRGVFSIAKLSTDTPAQGAALYWDNTNKRLTTTASGNTLAGYAAKAAGSGATTVEISINA